MIAVEEAQGGANIAIARGETLAVRLREQATTGYRWTVEETGGLEPQEDLHAPHGPAPGAAGLHEFRFLAAEPGNHLLRLKHWRDWQGEGSIIGRWHLHVTVD